MPRMTADATREGTPIPISLIEKVTLFVRVWVTAARIQLSLRRRPLPEVAAAVAVASRRPHVAPVLLSRAVTRSLHVGRWRPRCLLRSLVLFHLLREQGDDADLVIGLAERPESHDAHAWVEIEGEDVGPWPGRGRHAELARYPRSS